MRAFFNSPNGMTVICISIAVGLATGTIGMRMALFLMVCAATFLTLIRSDPPSSSNEF